MSEVITALQKQADIVLFDAPPLLAVSGAGIYGHESFLQRIPETRLALATGGSSALAQAESRPFVEPLFVFVIMLLNAGSESKRGRSLMVQLLGVPLLISSGFRSRELNELVGGQPIVFERQGPADDGWVAIGTSAAGASRSTARTSAR